MSHQFTDLPTISLIDHHAAPFEAAPTDNENIRVKP